MFHAYHSSHSEPCRCHPNDRDLHRRFQRLSNTRVQNSRRAHDYTAVVFKYSGPVFFSGGILDAQIIRGKSFLGDRSLGFMLLCGLTFDSTLLAYQIFVAQTFCGYCLVVFGFVLLLNLLKGRMQVPFSFAIVGMILFSFSILSFVPGGSVSKTFSLKQAAYGHKSCSAPTKEIYLFFSSECSHCQSILESLNQCNSCDLYFNPIADIENWVLPG